MHTRIRAVLAGATVLVVGGIGTSAVIASATGADVNPLNESVPAEAEQAALDEVGGGEVTDTESDDEEGTYEIEVTRDDGTQVDVHLDSDFAVLKTDEDGVDDDGTEDGTEDDGTEDDGSGGNETDDRALSAAEQKQAEQAALGEVEGEVTDVGAEDGTVDGRPVTYEVEVTRADRTEVDVYLDRGFAVVMTVDDGTADADADSAPGSDDD